MSGERLQCPVCGCTVKTAAKLAIHVESHFASQEAAGPDMVECSEPNCGQLVPVSELDAHEAMHRSAAAASGSQAPPWTGQGVGEAAPGASAGPPAQCVLCTLGCGQWIPLAEINDHEQLHQAVATSQSNGHVPAAAAVPPPADNQDLLQRLNQGLRTLDKQGQQTLDSAPNTSAATGQQGPADEEMAAALQAAQWGGDEDQDDDLWGQQGGDEGEGGQGGAGGGGGGTRRWRPGCRRRRTLLAYRPNTASALSPSNPKAARNQPKLPIGDAPVLASLQRVDPQWARGGDQQQLVNLLANCLQQQHQTLQSGAAWLCGPIAHFGGQQGDRGWGCGWRNMQMQISHLLLRPSSPYPSMIFGGQRIVPDIGSLQAWLETAWSAGFDLEGAESLGDSIQGETKWVGTTEAAAMLAFQGVPTHIVDFKAAPGAPPAALDSQGRTIHPGVQCDVCGQCPIVGTRHHSTSRSDYDLCDACAHLPGVNERDGPFHCTGTSGQPPAAGSAGQGSVVAAPGVTAVTAEGRDQGDGAGGASGPSTSEQAWPSHPGVGNEPRNVMMTGLPPLYFQHAGHSRTIIGVERKPAEGAAPPAALPVAGTVGPVADDVVDTRLWAYNLLILDPSTSPHELASTLRSGMGWQRLLKRGLHTLKHSEYQLLFTLDQPLDARGAQAAKIVRAAEVINT